MYKYNNEKGQTLVIMFALMVVALTIGISVATKFTKNLSSLVQSDTSARALAVAEAAVEHVLLLPITTLENYAINGNCATDCTLQITADDGQILSATVTLSVLGNSTDPFLIDLKMDEASQVNLTGYPDNQDIYVCWNASDMSVSGLYIHGDVGSYEADAHAYNPPTTSHSENNFGTTSSLFGYNNCFTITSKSDSEMLRLKSFYEDNIAIILPAVGQTLPSQGILVESVGSAGNTSKTVSVLIFDPVLPMQFDYTLMQKSASVPLSN